MTAVTQYKWPRLSRRVWGISHRWFAICPWNDYGEFWVQLPLVYFGAGIEHIELGLGRGKWYVMFEIRWRWS